MHLLGCFLLQAQDFFCQLQLGLLVDRVIKSPDHADGEQELLGGDFPVGAVQGGAGCLTPVAALAADFQGHRHARFHRHAVGNPGGGGAVRGEQLVRPDWVKGVGLGNDDAGGGEAVLLARAPPDRGCSATPSR